jgi:hypothetical protein
LLTGVVLVPTLTAAVLLERYYPGQEAELSTTLGKGLLVAMIWVASCAVGWRWGGWGRMLKKG